jgi:DNA-binding response OmpR family regulator
MNTSPTILVVDDEPHILSFLHDNLSNDDYAVITASSLAKARSLLHAHSPDVIVLDVMLPDGTGFDLCREVRAGGESVGRVARDIPIIMLTARGEEVDRVRGFQRGADDYVIKPFHYPELLARIGVCLRRSAAEQRIEALHADGINIDTVAREVLVNGTRVELSAKEFQLLATLAREPRRVFRKQELLESVWGYRSVGATRTLDSHASRLRRKLRPFSAGREYISNVWGVGYRFVAVDGGHP